MAMIGLYFPIVSHSLSPFCWYGCFAFLGFSPPTAVGAIALEILDPTMSVWQLAIDGLE
jgi:hypothetical protein